MCLELYSQYPAVYDSKRISIQGLLVPEDTPLSNTDKRRANRTLNRIVLMQSGGDDALAIMKFLKMNLSPSQIKALLRKDIIVRYRQPWMPIVQFFWPCAIFMLLYLVRLKFGPEEIEDCQFPTRLLPTKHNVVPSFHSYICGFENKCLSPKKYEEYTSWDKAPMKPIVDIVQIFINDDNLFNSFVELPEKASFLRAVTTLVTGGHFDEIRINVQKVIAMVPQVEKMLNGSFDIKKLFSDRDTFVRGGYLLCGQPFPSTESIPLINDILYSEDFSEVNEDELKVLPTKYCKQLYLDVTSTNHGKLTWNTIKPIIHGKILYTPNDSRVQSIMKFANATFEEINRLKKLSVALEQILTKLHGDKTFQKSFESILKLAQSPIVQSIVGDDIDLGQIETVMQRIRTDPVIYDVVQTVKNLLECFSEDRFVAVDEPDELHKKAFELNSQRLFYAAVHFDQTNSSEVVYRLHMDTENTRSTIENKNRFWFPGPAGNMINDMQYHRGFVQIKQALDLAIIKHKKKLVLDATKEEVDPSITTTESSFSVHVANADNEDYDDDDDDDEWFTSSDSHDNKTSKGTTGPMTDWELTTTEIPMVTSLLDDVTMSSNDLTSTPKIHVRSKRQGLLDLFFGSKKEDEDHFEVDDMHFYTKQFPYPAYTHDDFKTGIYLAQAVQTAFFFGLVAHIASCVRHRIWMRESRNTMIMRSMGLNPCSEMAAWITMTFSEQLLIFIAVTVILYTGGILMYTQWLFVMVFLVLFGICLIAFCYMCSTFFTSATIGAVATVVFFFISFCPYILVLLFDSKLNSLEYFCMNLSFTTAFSYAWNYVMRMELQQVGLSFSEAFRDGLHGEFGFGFTMIILDTILYVVVGYINQRYKDDEFRFIEVTREDLDSSLGSTMTNVSKVYDDNNFAVSNVSLSFAKNQITCLLGRNGAGKSTIIKLLTGQVVQTSGRVVLSQAMTRSDEYDKIGVCSQDNILIPQLTAREHLEMYAMIKLKHGYKSEVEKTLRSLNFGKYENYQATQLSGGYQRRLCVAIAFIGSPNVVILDEPCNGIDTKARKDIWELIERLRKGRAVIFATHFLDEAEYLSDAIVILKNGKVVARHTPETLKQHCAETFEISLDCRDLQTCDEVRQKARECLNSYKLIESPNPTDLRLEIAYEQESNNCSDFIAYLENLQQKGQLSNFYVESKNLEELFKRLDREAPQKFANGHAVDVMRPVEMKNQHATNSVRERNLTRWEAVRELFWKRLVHFSRNYRILLCVLVFPVVFEILAMWFVSYRLEDDFDKVVRFRRDLYPKTTQFFSIEHPTNFTAEVYGSLIQECAATDKLCQEFPNSEQSFYWVLNTLKSYIGKRYGGYTFNESNAMIWYNNKGYHAMLGWLNDLNTHIFQAVMNDTNYTITSYNEPWKLGDRELSTVSILRQVGDSVLVIILLIAFSLVIAAASVYLVNERINGEKLQQKLCGVDSLTYWAVAFVWDFLIMILSLLVCAAVILTFGIPVFVDRQQLWGIIVISLFFGFACIPGVYVIEKCFSDSSVAIMTIFCMNVIIPLFTMAIIVLLGVIGDSAAWDNWRYFLNRAFLIFPQHALSDALLEICKNYMVAQIFHRYDIDSYKNPLNSNLLLPHFVALFVLGISFSALNIFIESGLLYRWKEKLCFRQEKRHVEELKIVSIQNSLKRNDKYDAADALKVNNLCKFFKRGQYVVRNVTFAVKSGECFGLLGKNGAGKSTIFKMLSGEMKPTAGRIDYIEHEISYCPQTTTLDSLLTVRECIEFYGRLRRINNIPKLVVSILESYQLESYRDVLVRNLSGGNRRKLTVATSCLGRTSVVLMDEPTSDMDPITRALVYRTIGDLIVEQRAIVLTSHSISEIEGICHRIGVLKEGQMLTCNSPENLKAEYGGYYQVVVFCDHTQSAMIAKEVLQRFPFCHDLQIYARSIKFGVKIDSVKDVAEVCESGIDISGYTSGDSAFKLSDLFNSLDSFSKKCALRYTVNRCRLDSVFERILDTNEADVAAMSDLTNGYISTGALSGGPATGYIHNGFIESETVT